MAGSAEETPGTERYVTKVSSKGQTTIPKPIRVRFDVESEGYVVWEEEDGIVRVRPTPVPPTDDFEELSSRIAERFSDKGITPEDVEEAIRWARGQP